MAIKRLKSYIKNNPRRVVPLAIIVLATSALGVQLLLQSMAAICQPKGQIAVSVRNVTTDTVINDANSPASAVQARTGDIVQYTIKVVNRAPSSNSGYNDMYNVKISDTLPAGVELVSNPANRTVLLDLGTIDAGKSALKQFNVRVTSVTANVMINNRGCYTSESKYAGADDQSGCDFALVHVKGIAINTPTPVPTPTPTPTPNPSPTPTSTPPTPPPVKVPTPVHPPTPTPTPTSSPTASTPNPSPTSSTSSTSSVATTIVPGTEQITPESSGTGTTQETSLESSQNQTAQTNNTGTTAKTSKSFWSSPWRWLIGLLLLLLAGALYVASKRRRTTDNSKDNKPSEPTES